eukprot:TRINITY_DN17027_c0_g1_i1.p2 TRINITY_DN17027_c0_g1~~TRINITY_DN17027_c0_g1_i1.p2  ORF type:complete len:106 (+),score=7.83 TRINITY_DN17027_c0_g1_i1:3-320(+)
MEVTDSKYFDFLRAGLIVCFVWSTNSLRQVRPSNDSNSRTEGIKLSSKLIDFNRLSFLAMKGEMLEMRLWLSVKASSDIIPDKSGTMDMLLHDRFKTWREGSSKI